MAYTDIIDASSYVLVGTTKYYYNSSKSFKVPKGGVVTASITFKVTRASTKVRAWLYRTGGSYLCYMGEATYAIGTYTKACSFTVTDSTQFNTTFVTNESINSGATWQASDTTIYNNTMIPVTEYRIEPLTVNAKDNYSGAGISSAFVTLNSEDVGLTNSSGIWSGSIGCGGSSVLVGVRAGYYSTPSTQVATCTTTWSPQTKTFYLMPSRKVALTVTTKDLAGNAISGAKVMVSGAAVGVTNSSGVFSKTVGCSSSSVSVSVSASGYATPATQTANCTSTGNAVSLTFALSPSGSCSVILSALDAMTTAPLVGAAVSVGGTNVGTTDASGYLKFNVSSCGTKLIQISKTGYCTGGISQLIYTPNQFLELLIIPNYYIDNLVIYTKTSSGAAVPNVKIYSNGVFTGFRTGSSGRMALKISSPTQYASITVKKSGYSEPAAQRATCIYSNCTAEYLRSVTLTFILNYTGTTPTVTHHVYLHDGTSVRFNSNTDLTEEEVRQLITLSQEA